MTLTTALGLFLAMLALAVVPGPSVVAVVARTLSSGVLPGLMMTAGLVAGDFVLILLVAKGLAIAATQLTSLFTLLQYLGSAYLIWLAIQLFRTQPTALQIAGGGPQSRLSDFVGGVAITLSDPKALLFYVSFLPAYIDLSQASWASIAGLMAAALLAVGGSKLGYVYATYRAKRGLVNLRIRRWLNIFAGLAMLATAAVLLFK